MAPKTLSDAQKAAMAEGRREARIVEGYLSSLERKQVHRGRRSGAEIARELDRVNGELQHAAAMDRLALLQAREDLQREALEVAPEDDAELEAQFIAIVRTYGERKGISYSTWREIGVPKGVLEAAGIPRTRRPNQPK
jgi:hypothetical protein